MFEILMSTVQETGHDKNVALFQGMVTVCVSYGTSYNPSRDALKVSALNEMVAMARQTITNFHEVVALLKKAKAEREIAYKALSPLTTRLIMSLRSSGSAKRFDEMAQSYSRKIRGMRLSKKATEPEVQSLSADVVAPKSISASQMSFDNRLENFDKFVQFLSLIPEFNPNENELKISELFIRRDQLRMLNDSVLELTSECDRLRMMRNVMLYKPVVGMLDISLDVKSYVRSVFGGSSEQVKRLAKYNLRGSRMTFGEELPATETAPL